MNDTPRTDAVAWPAEGGETHKWVSYDFACGLERELQRAEAKLSERKTVHEWLNAANIPVYEPNNPKPLCLLRRLRIAIDQLTGGAAPMLADDAQAVVALIAMRTGLRAIEKEGK